MAGANDATLRLAGWLWFVLWCALLYLIHSPWRELGGLVSELLRWWERFALAMGLTLGCYIGTLERGRACWLPAAALTAVALLVLRLMALADIIGIVFNGFAAYWAGIDIAHGAYPLMMGERDGRPPEGEEPPHWLGV